MGISLGLVGLGAFGSAYLLYQATDYRVPHFEYAHNDWLNLMVDVGVIGFLLLVTGPVLWFHHVVRQRRRLHTYQRGLLAGMPLSLRRQLRGRQRRHRDPGLRAQQRYRP